MSPDRVAGPKTQGGASAQFPWLADEILGDTPNVFRFFVGGEGLASDLWDQGGCIPHVSAIHLASSYGPGRPLWAEIHQIWFLKKAWVTPHTRTQASPKERTLAHIAPILMLDGFACRGSIGQEPG